MELVMPGDAGSWWREIENKRITVDGGGTNKK